MLKLVMKPFVKTILKKKYMKLTRLLMCVGNSGNRAYHRAP